MVNILSDEQIEKNKNLILSLLRKINRPGMDKLIKFLKESDFFTAPASTRYHLCCLGGLAQHSLNVTKLFDAKCKKFDVDIINDSILLCGLLHDFCKINLYIKANKWVKTKGKWNEEEVWSFKEQKPLGHGAKSVILIQNFINLTLQEQVLIRWHMGLFEIGHDERKYYFSAINKFPETVLIHTADWESTTMLDDI